MRKIFFIAVLLICLSGCDRLKSIPYSPEQTPESWLQIQPYVEIEFGKVDFVLVQPSSTVFVYLLGVITIGVGLFFFRIRDKNESRKWWGIALFLWGLGALFAGTSYQAFSYEIKCSGQALCSWTSWWEIIYLLLSVASIDAMLISGAYSSCKEKKRKVLIYWAILNIVLYGIMVAVGVQTLNKFLISFELLLIVTTPNILILFILNGWRYYKNKSDMDLALLITWVWLGLVIGIYFIYLVIGVTEKLWDHGIWFSENDVLHIGLISWMMYIAKSVAKRITDISNSGLISSGNEMY